MKISIPPLLNGFSTIPRNLVFYFIPPHKCGKNRLIYCIVYIIQESWRGRKHGQANNAPSTMSTLMGGTMLLPTAFDFFILVGATGLLGP